MNRSQSVYHQSKIVGLEYFIRACLNLTNYDVQEQNVKENQYVKYLDLSKNNFTWKGVIIVSNYNLSKLIRVTFAQIHIRDPLEFHFGKAFANLLTLNLSQNNVGSLGAKMLTKSDIKKLRNFKINNCNISDNGLIHLYKADWKHLTNLQLSDNDIWREGPNFIVRGFWKNLTEINLNWNKMTKQGSVKLLSSDWKQLETSWMKYNQIIPNYRPKLKQSFHQKHPQFTIIDL